MRTVVACFVPATVIATPGIVVAGVMMSYTPGSVGPTIEQALATLPG